MNDKWIEFAIRIQSIAQAGLRYGKDQYDKERYEELREIAAEMLSLKTDIPVNKVFDLFCGESGYQEQSSFYLSAHTKTPLLFFSLCIHFCPLPSSISGCQLLLMLQSILLLHYE